MAVVDDMERAELLGDNEGPAQLTKEGFCRRTFGSPVLLIVDIIASIPFYWFMFFAVVPDNIFYPCLWGFIGLMVLWRIYRAYSIPQGDEQADVPYTVGIVKSNDKTMFLVATIHISPKSPVDVEQVIDKCSPDTVMIELDDERLDRMRAPPAPPAPAAAPAEPAEPPKKKTPKP